jgi:hypothetical protein
MIRMIRFAAAAFLCAAMGAGAATISGTVRTAATAAGGTAAPVPGAKVILLQYSLTGGLGGAGQAHLDSTTTDAQGQYAFAKADTGIRLLSAEKAGYQNGTGLVRVASDTGHYTANLTLRALPDTTPGFLKATVLSGSAQGTPVAGATLVLASGFGGIGGGTRADTVKADDKGQYLFKDLAPAAYSVRASAAGFQARTASATVRSRDTAAVEIVLLPENPTGSIAGKVVKASDGSAVSGAQVIVARGGILGGGGGSKPDTVTTGADGSYKVDSVPAQQSYTLTVKASGYQTAISAGVSVAYNQIRTADFFLVPALAGDSTHGSVAGVVEDSARKGLAGARIVLTSGRIGGGGGGGAGAGTSDTVVSDAQGRFVFPKLAAGSYRLTATLAGYQGASETGLNVAAGETFVATLTLRKATALRPAAQASGGMRLYAGPTGRLILETPAAPAAGRVRAFDARGALRFAASLPAGATHLDIPWFRGKTGYVVVERGGEIHRWTAAAAP